MDRHDKSIYDKALFNVSVAPECMTDSDCTGIKVCKEGGTLLSKCGTCNDSLNLCVC